MQIQGGVSNTFLYQDNTRAWASNQAYAARPRIDERSRPRYKKRQALSRLSQIRGGPRAGSGAARTATSCAVAVLCST
jgi:hypothetical protein